MRAPRTVTRLAAPALLCSLAAPLPGPWRNARRETPDGPTPARLDAPQFSPAAAAPASDATLAVAGGSSDGAALIPLGTPLAQVLSAVLIERGTAR